MLSLTYARDVVRSGRQRSTVIFGVATFFYWAALYIYVPVLPVYALSLGASFAVVGLMVSAYGFSQLCLRIPIGLASDRWGRRKPFSVIGLLFASAGCIVLFFAPNPGWLVVGRAIVGISAAAWVTITVMFSDYFKPAQLPGAMALLTFLSGLSQLVSTGAGGWLADLDGPRAPFVVGIVFGVIGAILLFLVPEERVQKKSTATWKSMAKVGTSSYLLRVSIVGALLQFTFWATTYAFVPVYAHNLGASKTMLGLLTSGALVPYTLASLAVSRWAVRVGAARLATVGLAFCVVGAGVVPLTHSIALLAASQCLAGLGRGLTMPVLLGLAIQRIAPSEKATAMGVFQAVYAIGMFLGPASAGLIAESLGLTGAFLISASMCLAAVVVLLGGRKDWQTPARS